MAAPRLRNRLATTAPTGPTEEEEKVKGKKTKAEGDEDEGEASEGDEEENEASEEGDEEEGEGKAKKGAKSARAAERARVQAITTGAAAQRFPALAEHLAYGTGLSAKSAGAILSAAAKDADAQAAAGGKVGASGKADSFRRAMAAEAPNPPLGTAADGGEKPRLMSFHEIRAAKADAKRK